MVVILKDHAEQKKVKNLTDWLENQGLSVHSVVGQYQTILGLIGDTSKVDIDLIQGLDIVEKVKRISEPYKNANRKFHPDDTVIDVNGVKIGGGNFQFFAGPCAPRRMHSKGCAPRAWNFCWKRKRKQVCRL